AGYANATTTRLLVYLRDKHSNSAKQRAEHYLVSIPGLSSFLLAHGSGPGTVLTPISDDGSIRIAGQGIAANRQYRADALMPALSHAALHLASSAVSARELR